MTTFIEIFFWLSTLLLLFIFFFYPISLYIVQFFRNKKVNKKEIFPSVSLVIAAYNEEEVIEKKIRNSFSLTYPKEKLEVIVVSDGSDDNTNQIIGEYDNSENFKGIILQENKGKTVAINSAVKEAEGEIIVFTDANVWLDGKAIQYLVSNFSDEGVGCVCGQLNYYNPTDSETAKTGSLYWRYEEFIKKYESMTGSTMGADGSIFAIRRHLYRSLESYLIDDFSTSMGIMFQGYRIVFEPEAKAYEKHTTELSDEIRRRKRIANRVFTAIDYFREEFLKLDIFDKYKFFMHKFGRYWAGLLMGVTFISNSLLAFKSDFYLYLWFLQIVFYGLSIIGFIFTKVGNQIKLFYIPYYFSVMNWMQLLGVIDSLRGRRQVTWKTKNSSRI